MASASNAFIEGRGATISNFADGIEIDGAKAALENFTVTANSDAGLYLKSASQAAISNFTADSNTNDGVRISKGSYNTIVGQVRATNNGRYGVWLLGTSHNNLGGFYVEDNAIAGVYAGCSSSGPIAAPCKPAVPDSKFNAVFDGSVQASSDGTQTYGVVIDTGNDSNRVTNISSPSPYEKFDLDDENHECAHNAWLGNGVIFSLTPTDCIH
jgi:parallel beta-helix repeat protein